MVLGENAPSYPNYTTQYPSMGGYEKRLKSGTASVMRDIEIDVILAQVSYKADKAASPVMKPFRRTQGDMSYRTPGRIDTWREDSSQSLRYLENPLRRSLASDMGASYGATPGMGEAMAAISTAEQLMQGSKHRYLYSRSPLGRRVTNPNPNPNYRYSRSPLGAAVREGLRLSESYNGSIANLQARGAEIRASDEASNLQVGSSQVGSVEGVNKVSVNKEALSGTEPLPMALRTRAVKQFQAMNCDGHFRPNPNPNFNPDSRPWIAMATSSSQSTLSRSMWVVMTHRISLKKWEEWMLRMEI